MLMARYYKLKPDLTFFEGQKIGPDPPDLPPELGNERNKYPHKAQIINGSSKQTYKLNDSAAFIARLLLMDVDIDTLSQLYFSRFGVSATEALALINAFITGPPEFFVEKTLGRLSEATPQVGPPENHEYIWADFSMGSLYAVGGIRKPV